ncbi:MAG: organomercurial lyase [Pseudomonadota bacterium]
MNKKIKNALKRLNDILPLYEKQQQSGEQIKLLHQHILRSFVTQGRILSREEMAEYVDNLDEAINILSNNDMVTFSETGTPMGAYPFTMEVLEHKVQVNGFTVHAMCALDALAVSSMFNIKTQITSLCRVTAEPINIEQSGEAIENISQTTNIHFGIIWAAADASSSCADSLCMDMIFLKDKNTAQQWLMDSPENREIFTLTEAVEFSSRFFTPLIS